jgi:hypothetical protein
MFDEILKEVKEKLTGHPEITGKLTPEEEDKLHNEIATHVHDTVQNQPAEGESQGGFLSNITENLGSGNILTSAVAGGILGSIGSRFGLSNAVTGAIAASIPGLVHKYLEKKSSATPAQG